MGCSSAIASTALDAIRIVLERETFESCLDRLESSKAFLGSSGSFTGALGLARTALVAGKIAGLPNPGLLPRIRVGFRYDLPTKGKYEEHLTQYYQLMRKYGAIIDRDISIIKASAIRIMTADNAG